MAFVSLDRLAGKTQRVKLLMDQKIKGVALKEGDTCDLPVAEAVYLKAIERVEFAVAETPKQSTR